MNKKEFYEAPKWGTRVVVVERQFLQNPSGETNSVNDGYTEYNLDEI